MGIKTKTGLGKLTGTATVSERMALVKRWKWPQKSRKSKSQNLLPTISCANWINKS